MAHSVRVEEDHVVVTHELALRDAPLSVAPDDFVAKVRLPEHPVQQQFQIVARGRIAVEVQAAGRFQHAVQFDQADRHHRQIGHHVVVAQEAAHGVQQVERLGMAAARDPVEGVLRAVVPVPAILERGDLRIGGRAGGRAEEDVVGGIRIERRVEIDQVDAGIRDFALQDREIVAVVQVVRGPVLHPGMMHDSGGTATRTASVSDATGRVMRQARPDRSGRACLLSCRSIRRRLSRRRLPVRPAAAARRCW